MNGIWEWLRKILGGGRGPAREQYVLAIDPGHGGRFPGATVEHPDRPGQNVMEKDITLAIGLKLGRILEREGHRIIYTREDDSNLSDDLNADLRQRADIANTAGAEVFVSIHCNSAENQAASGIEVYHFPGSTRGRELATHIHDKLMLTFPDRQDRGVKAENFAVLRLTTMPSCLVETEFMTNPDALRFLLDPKNQQKIAEAMRDGIYAYFRSA